MVVDDDPAMRAFVETFLTERGHRVIALPGPREALTQYRAERPAAVILDVAMPGDMDGLGTLAAFKDIDPGVPVVMLSGEGRASIIVQAMKLGAADFVSKPFDDTDLERLLTHALHPRPPAPPS